MTRTIGTITVVCAVLLLAGLASATELAVPRAAAAPKSGAVSVVVTDATDVLLPDVGAVYRIHQTGMVDTIASGAPLQSPAGVMFYDSNKNGQQFIVSDIGTFFDMEDGAIYLLGDDMAPVIIYAGAPLSSPLGLALHKLKLYVADFQDPDPALEDGVIYELNLDPDEDKKPGPFPLSSSALREVWNGAPLRGPNEIIWLKKGKELLVADDSGYLYRVATKDKKGTPRMPEALPAELGDPVGLAALKKGYVVADAANQEVLAVDKKGEQVTLLLGGTAGIDQFLGLDASKKGRIAVANAGALFSSSEDGQVILLDEASVTLFYSGAPLVNPFSLVLFAE